MRYRKQPQHRLNRLWFALLFIVLLPFNVQADKFSIRQAQANFDKTSLSVDATFDLQLKASVEEALHNGVGINLVIHLDLYKNRRYVWDERIARWAFVQSISYHALTNRYVLSSSDSNDLQSFSSLTDLFNSIASFNFQSDILSDTLPSSKQGYKLRLEIALDKTALPAPLRIMSYILPTWRQKSDVYEWFIDN